MSSVRRIVAIAADGTTNELYRVGSGKKKKVDAWARPIAKAAKKLLRAQQTFASELLARQDRNSRKKKNGFVRDGLEGIDKANRKAAKHLKP